MRSRRGVALLAGLAMLCVPAACGSDGSTATLTIETSDPNPDRVAMRVPAEVAAGEVEIELRNRGDMLHDAQLFRASGRQDVNALAFALEAADGSEKPRWLHPVGGVAATRPGETASVTQVLAPGTYFVADTQERTVASGAHVTNAIKRGIARIEVAGDDDGAALPETPAKIVARDYGFEASGIVAGRNRVTFRNEGDEFHQAVAFPIPRRGSFKAGRRAVLDREAGTSWVPVDAPAERATAVLEGGGEQVTEMAFRPGRYVLLCFVSDRAGGPQHWTLGMGSELRVPPASGR
jgi:hypothetical protein